MKELIRYFIYAFLSITLPLRYRIKVKKDRGLKRLPKGGGIIFLANHPAEIDPCILLRALWFPYRPHPVAIDYLFHKPVVRSLLELVEAFPIPSFDDSSNSFKRRQIEQTFNTLAELLRKGENLLIYPGGGLKSQAEEILGGASGVKKLLELCPEANVVLVRTLGLWGSSFSRAKTGKTPELLGAFWNGFKVLLKNGIFFTPRRKVTVEVVPAPADFPFTGSRRDQNRYLEEWFNAGGPEPLNLVSYAFWKNEIPQIHEREKVQREILETIPETIQQKVKEEIAKLTGMPASQILPHQELARDLGLDSLDLAQIVVMLKENFGIFQVRSSDLITVETVMGFAAGFLKSENVEEEEIKPLLKWESEEGRPHPSPSNAKTIPEAFLKCCERMGDYLACADSLSGEISYRRLKLAVLLLASAIEKIPGQRVGILLPASVAVNVVILATLFARKTPVMINWTLGERNLLSVLEQSGIDRTISSWAFLDRLENVELNGIDQQMILLEDLRRGLSLRQKMKAAWLARKSTPYLMRYFRLQRQKATDPAVILFTSGTENVPKGVPLSHKNILSNQKSAFQYVEFKPTDILLGALPPFHSFGFSVTGLLPLLSGLRVAFSPNPTDGRRIALGIERWKISLICIAPTFLKNTLRVGTAEQLKTLRLVVCGAERTPPEMYEKLAQLNSNAELVEGYGITECAPILTLNPPGKPKKGVGLAIPNVELLVVHPETHETLPRNTEGLILTHGPNVFSGYLDPDLPSPFVQIDEKRWYNTGDLGFLDENGYLTLSGRLKRFVKIGGEMISLNAIEEVLIQAAPQKGWKLHPQNPSLGVLAREESGKKGEIHLFTIFPLTPDEVNRVLKEAGMSNLIKISSVHQLPYIPILGTGKIDYRALKEKA